MIYQRMRYFLKVAKEGSFSKAAKQLYVTSQALTKQIKLLEEELGGRLFDRTPQGVVLTRLGLYALKKFEKIDHEFEETVEDLKVRAKDYKERLNIGIFSALPQETFVTPLVSFLLASFPEYQINLNLMGLFEGKRQLLEHKIDILLSNVHEEDALDDYKVYAFGSYEAQVIVSLRHPWAMKDSITVEDMKQSTFLKMESGNLAYNVSEQESFYEHIPCKKVQKVDNFDTMYALLQQGEAFSVFPMYFANMDHAKIKAFDYPGRSFKFYTALVYDPNSEIVELNRLVNEMKDEFELNEIIYKSEGV